MTNSSGIDNQFNMNSADDNGGPIDRDQESRRNRARNKVVDYHEADEDLKQQMERIMQPIDRNPDSFDAIITYGHPPLEDLGKIANSMIAVQSRFNDQVNVMASAMSQLQEGLQGMRLDKFGEATQKLLKGMVNTGAKGVKGTFGFGKKLLDGLTGASAKRTEDEKLVQEMQNALPQMLNEMVRLVDSISKTEQGIKEVMKEAEKLGIARLEATRSINIYLGAGKEVLRRYNEEYIPEAQQAFDESADPEDQMYLQDIMKRKDDFIDRLAVLEGSRAASVVAAQQLKQMMETMEDQRKKVQDIMYNSQNEWKAMLAAAGIAGSSLKAAQTIRKADEFGDKMHDQTMHMIEEAHKMTLNSKARGTIDPQKLIEATERLQKMIESENSAREDRLRQLEATSQQLRGATDRLIEAADSSNQRRLLEGVKAAEEEAARAREAVEQQATVSNDNKDAATPAATPKAPARTRTRRGPGL